MQQPVLKIGTSANQLKPGLYRLGLNHGSSDENLCTSYGAQANGCATTFAARFVYMVLVVSISKFVSEFEVWIVRKAGGLCV